jgi:hypothetical protein
MKTLLIVFLLPLLAFTGNQSPSRLNGAYQPAGTGKGTARNGTDITLLFNGHWVQFGTGTGGVRGGTFQAEQGRYYQQTQYCFTGSGSELRVFAYSLKGKKLWRGVAGSRSGDKPAGEYIRRIGGNARLRHRNLEGVWQLAGSGINGNCANDQVTGLACLLYNVYPMFVQVSYLAASGKVLGLTTGRYTYNYASATCTRTVEYSSSPEIQPGQVFTSPVTLHDNAFELGNPALNPPQIWVSATAKRPVILSARHP